MHDGTCNCTVSNAWNCCFFLSGLTTIKTKLQRLRSDLLQWNKFFFGNVQHHIAGLENRLSIIQQQLLLPSGQSSSSSTPLTEQELEIRTELEKW